MKNLSKYFTPTYNLVYIPEKSENGDGVTQSYQVIGNPKTATLRSLEGNKFFTLPVQNRDEKFRSFRLDRMVESRLAIMPSVNFAFATFAVLLCVWSLGIALEIFLN